METSAITHPDSLIAALVSATRATREQRGALITIRQDEFVVTVIARQDGLEVSAQIETDDEAHFCVDVRTPFVASLLNDIGDTTITSITMSKRNKLHLTVNGETHAIIPYIDSDNVPKPVAVHADEVVEASPSALREALAYTAGWNPVSISMTSDHTVLIEQPLLGQDWLTITVG